MSGNRGINSRSFLIGAVAAGVIPLAVYMVNLAPSVNFQDAGEFACSALVLGINHPSGYPLETLLAHLFTYIPAGDMGWRMNLSSAVAAALAALFVFLTTWEILSGTEERARAAGAWAAAALFAFSRTFWSQAVITEVYALSTLTTAAAVWLSWRAGARQDPRWFLGAVFTAGLGAANHPLSLVITGPAAAYGLSRVWRAGGGWRLVPLAAALFVAALSIYLYLPLRSSRNPAFNWGTPFKGPLFLDHVRRREFGTIFWPRYRYIGSHLLELGKLLFYQFGPALGLAAAAGWVWLARRRLPGGRVMIGLALIAGPAMLIPLVGLLTPIQTFEIDVWYIIFFMLAAVAAGVVAGLGGERLTHPIGRRLLLAGICLIPFYPAIYNFAPNNLHTRYFPAEHGRNLLRNLPYRALVLVSFYDRVGLYEELYPRLATHRRPDVAFADSRNTVRSNVDGARGAPVYTRDPDRAAQWWHEFKTSLMTGGTDRPIFFNGFEPVPEAWGAAQEPYGMLFYARPLSSPGMVAKPFPWDRLEVRGWEIIAGTPPGPRSPYEPSSYTTWAGYSVFRAGEEFQAGDDARALSRLEAVAAHALAVEGIPLWLANTYGRFGYPRRAIPLFVRALNDMEPYRHDAVLFKREYASILNGLAREYLTVGDIDAAASTFEDSLSLNPEQPELRASLNRQTLEKTSEFLQTRSREGNFGQ